MLLLAHGFHLLPQIMGISYNSDLHLFSLCVYIIISSECLY